MKLCIVIKDAMIFWKSIKLLEMTGLNHVFYVEVQDLLNAPRILDATDKDAKFVQTNNKKNL